MADGNGAFLVAYRDDQPVGCGAVRLIGPATAEIKRMYVEPELRGAGIGRTLVDALEAEARRLGAEQVVLETGTRLWRLLSLSRDERLSRKVTGFDAAPL